jgi:hypothetical protein
MDSAELSVLQKQALGLWQLSWQQPSPPLWWTSGAKHHPQAQDVTYFTHSAARLERWLVADTLLPCCTSSTIQDLRPVNTDHLPVTVTIQPAGLPLLGKGLGGVPVGTLDDPAFRARVEALLTRAEAAAGHGQPRWSEAPGGVVQF